VPGGGARAAAQRRGCAPTASEANPWHPVLAQNLDDHSIVRIYACRRGRDVLGGVIRMQGLLSTSRWHWKELRAQLAAAAAARLLGCGMTRSVPGSLSTMSTCRNGGQRTRRASAQRGMPGGLAFATAHRGGASGA
jgi:hypothetical protein